MSVHSLCNFHFKFDPCLGCDVRTAWFYRFLLSVSWGRSWCISKHVLDQFHFLDWLLHNSIHNLQRFSGIPSSLSIRVTPACATACTQARSGIIPPPCWTLCKVFFSYNAALFFPPSKHIFGLFYRFKDYFRSPLRADPVHESTQCANYHMYKSTHVHRDTLTEVHH